MDLTANDGQIKNNMNNVNTDGNDNQQSMNNILRCVKCNKTFSQNSPAIALECQCDCKYLSYHEHCIKDAVDTARLLYNRVDGQFTCSWCKTDISYTGLYKYIYILIYIIYYLNFILILYYILFFINHFIVSILQFTQ